MAIMDEKSGSKRLESFYIYVLSSDSFSLLDNYIDIDVDTKRPFVSALFIRYYQLKYFIFCFY